LQMFPHRSPDSKPAPMKRLFKILLRTALILFVLLNVITAFHAHKFTHFYDRSEMPADAQQPKKGWPVIKDILIGAKAYKQQNREQDSSFEKVLLTTRDSIRLEGWYIPAAKAVGTVIMFHGHGSRKTAILDESAAFRQLGYNTLLLDFRAHGGSEGNESTIGYKESEDVLLAYRNIRARGEQKIILWGISMGAAAITSAMHQYPELKPSKLILEMPFASLHQAAEGRIKMMGLPGEPLGTFVTFWGSIVTGTWAFNFSPAEYAQHIQTPTLLKWGKHDPRVLQEETMAIYDALAGPKKMVVYENSGHQSLCKNEHEKWMASVSSFLQ